MVLDTASSVTTGTICTSSNKNITDSDVTCNTAVCLFSILAYVDDIVLLSSSWRRLQSLITLLHELANHTICHLLDEKYVYRFLT